MKRVLLGLLMLTPRVWAATDSCKDSGTCDSDTLVTLQAKVHVSQSLNGSTQFCYPTFVLVVAGLFGHDTSCTYSGEQWHSFFQQRIEYWWIAYSCFGIFAWCSLLREMWLKQPDTIPKRPRERLWDITKFCLQGLIWSAHAGLPGVQLYESWAIQGFLFLCGLVCTPAEINLPCVQKVIVSVLRDNILNVILITELLHILSGDYQHSRYRIGALWFLQALCTCRIGIPLCFHLTRRVGEISGSIMLVAIAFILPYVLEVTHVNLFFARKLDYSQDWLTLRIYRSWIFYVLGLLTDKQWLVNRLKTRAAACISIAIMGALVCLISSGFVKTYSIDQMDRSSGLYVLPAWTRDYATEGFRAYAWDTVAKQFYIILLLACLAPVSCIGGVVAEVLAQLGQRTLQAYIINVVFYFLGPDGSLTRELFLPREFRNTHVVLQYTMIFFATSVACCPLAEWCFGSLTSPQWIISIGAKMISLIKPDSMNLVDGPAKQNCCGL